MFRKVLIANRGEIAVRVGRTLREMGISPVAVYSEIDRTALHVRMADEAYSIGPAPSLESYLRGDVIIDVCKRAGVDAIHPGYGFLSENAAFATACRDAGIVFMGPDAMAIESMGSKTGARERMIAAGVPVVPGAHVSSLDELRVACALLQYPVLLKATAGGGGKGMRFVEREEDLADAYDRARGEAKSAFGDDTVYVEKALVGARHVEIQVLGDQHGNIVHLFERDCSLQRRHQKIVEESPSPAVSESLVREMGKVAVRAASAVHYHSAGTIEFLLAPDGSFFFLEMNTRLQVEHPITELVTGLDLVREQVCIAAGEPLGFTQEEVVRKGHAIECRVYAEDPDAGFLPSPGKINVLRVPQGPWVRDDSGVYETAVVSSFYDPLLSKLSVWAPNRAQAIARMRRGLSEYVVLGTTTNLAFLSRLMEYEPYVRGEYDIQFVERHRAELCQSNATPDDILPFAVAAAYADSVNSSAPVNPSRDTQSTWRVHPWTHWR